MNMITVKYRKNRQIKYSVTLVTMYRKISGSVISKIKYNLMTNRLLTIVSIGKVKLGQGEHFTLVIRYIYLLVIKLFKFRSIGF